MGSEMCIRDRFNIATNRAEIASADNALGLPDIDSTPDDTWDNDCLLYTSDAADERSSVDLGGRRIIKKKPCVDVCGKVVLQVE